MSKPRPFSTVQEFLFNAPLYTRYELSLSIEEGESLLGGDFVVDGHCVECGRETVFFRGTELHGELAEKLKLRPDQCSKFGVEIVIRCSRDPNHACFFLLNVEESVVYKIGQIPSLADIAKDESSTYAKELTEEDRKELHRAIGLAAHGMGIGSYVHLRRIFEHLIQQRFDEHKDAEKWSEEDFRNKRMEDRIKHLEGHLPRFLVETRKIYSILSKGIHELDEDECLGYFPILKMSIVEILKEDKRQREDREQRAELQRALSKIPSAKPSDGGDASA